MKRSLFYPLLFTTLSVPIYAADVSSVSPVPPPVAAAPAAPAPSAALMPMNCQYRIPLETTDIAPMTVTSWAEKAVVQSFDFNPDVIDTQLAALKNCFTDQGWLGFNDALQKSGNVKAIQAQHLTVSSMLDGKSNIEIQKANQWKVTLPIQVVYQNDKEKLTQVLNVILLVGRKVNGDLGILQLVATPRPAAATAAAAPAPAAMPPSNPPVNVGPQVPVGAPAPASKPH